MTLCFGSLFLLALGGVSLFAKDIMWGITEWSNSLRGVASKRTGNWETMTTISGVIFVILGALALYAFFQGG